MTDQLKATRMLRLGVSSLVLAEWLARLPLAASAVDGQPSS
jgi:hypothetical protein